MNWITTNLRLPEDLYMELRMKAAKERKSVAAIIREKLSTDAKKKIGKARAKELLARMEKLGKRIAAQNPGLDLTKGLREIRYEE